MKEAISALVKKIESTKDKITSEEATKHGFVLPFLSALGYDVFNPDEVNPEFIADVGIKLGEKVDYVIVINGEPALLIECKQCRSELSVENESQLIRYFHALKSKSAVARSAVSLFAVLTNGIVYKFFTDLEKTNILDTTPFLEIDLSKPQNINYDELEKFSKSLFNAESISTTAKELKIINAVRERLDEELTKNPSEEFVRCIFDKIPNKGNFTPAVKKELPPIIKAAIENIINNKVQAKLTEALAQINKKSEELTPKAEENSGIETTQDEIDALNIIKAIVCEIADIAKLNNRIGQSYCTISFDKNYQKVCRLYLKEPKKRSIGLFDTDSEVNVEIKELSKIFSLKSNLLATVKKYLS